MNTIKELECVLEAILFASGDPVPLEKLVDITGHDKKTLQGVLTGMIMTWPTQPRGIMVRELNGTYQLCTKPEYEEAIAQLGVSRRSPGLTQAAYETLSIIAYQQPVTRAVIEQIRGVSADSVLAKLQEKNLIHEAGREDAPGKPKLYETTTEFLRIFGFTNIRELPRLEMNELQDVLESLPVD